MLKKSPAEPPKSGHLPPPAAVVALEKVPSAAKRMGLSVGRFYAVAKRDGIRIAKVGLRASAVVSADVDAWIMARVAEVTRTMQTSARGADHE